MDPDCAQTLSPCRPHRLIECKNSPTSRRIGGEGRGKIQKDLQLSQYFSILQTIAALEKDKADLEKTNLALLKELLPLRCNFLR